MMRCPPLNGNKNNALCVLLTDRRRLNQDHNARPRAARKEYEATAEYVACGRAIMRCHCPKPVCVGFLYTFCGVSLSTCGGVFRN
jgi:hypothetical protein